MLYGGLASGDLEEYDGDQFFRLEWRHGGASGQHIIQMQADYEVVCYDLSAEHTIFRRSRRLCVAQGGRPTRVTIVLFDQNVGLWDVNTSSQEIKLADVLNLLYVFGVASFVTWICTSLRPSAVRFGHTLRVEVAETITYALRYGRIELTPILNDGIEGVAFGAALHEPTTAAPIYCERHWCHSLKDPTPLCDRTKLSIP
jgi:hypothetical protein